jgi:hypothetical protein
MERGEHETASRKSPVSEKRTTTPSSQILALSCQNVGAVFLINARRPAGLGTLGLSKLARLREVDEPRQLLKTPRVAVGTTSNRALRAVSVAPDLVPKILSV